MELIVKTELELKNVLADISFIHTVLDFKWKFEYKPVVIATDHDGPLAGSQREGWFG